MADLGGWVLGVSPLGDGAGSCGWQFDYSCDYSADEYDALDPDALERAEALALSTLRALTLGAVGNCATTVRPCGRPCMAQDGWTLTNGMWMNPHINWRGRWVNACGCPDECGCGSLSEIILPGPVGGVAEVWIDGDLLEPSAYRLDNRNRLVRVDGEQWPTCQDMLAGPRDSGAFSVTYWRGSRPGKSEFVAAGRLAAEFYSACTGGACSLPTSVVAMTRQGVTFQMETGLFPNNATGIKEVDAVLRVWNPYGVTVGTGVFSVDDPEPRRTVWSA